MRQARTLETAVDKGGPYTFTGVAIGGEKSLDVCSKDERCNTLIQPNKIVPKIKNLLLLLLLLAELEYVKNIIN